MIVYLVVSERPAGSKALVAQIKEFDGETWRSEIYDYEYEAEEMRDGMQKRWPEMNYYVKEVIL